MRVTMKDEFNSLPYKEIVEGIERHYNLTVDQQYVNMLDYLGDKKHLKEMGYADGVISTAKTLTNLDKKALRVWLRINQIIEELNNKDIESISKQEIEKMEGDLERLSEVWNEGESCSENRGMTNNELEELMISFEFGEINGWNSTELIHKYQKKGKLLSDDQIVSLSQTKSISNEQKALVICMLGVK